MRSTRRARRPRWVARSASTAEVLDAKAVAALDPGIRMDVEGAVYFPGDRHMTPDRFVDRDAGSPRRGRRRIRVEHRGHGLANRARTGTCVPSRRATAARSKRTNSCWPEARGRRASRANSDLALPIEAGKGYSLTLPAPPRLPAICAILTEARLAVTPMGGALRFAGTMEIAGLDEAINPVRIRGIIAAATKYYPEITAADFDGIAPWRGLRPCSPDGMPYIGRTAPVRESLDRLRPCDDGHEPRSGDRPADRRDPRRRNAAASTSTLVSPDRYARR